MSLLYGIWSLPRAAAPTVAPVRFMIFGDPSRGDGPPFHFSLWLEA